MERFRNKHHIDQIISAKWTTKICIPCESGLFLLVIVNKMKRFYMSWSVIHSMRESEIFTSKNWFATINESFIKCAKDFIRKFSRVKFVKITIISFSASGTIGIIWVRWRFINTHCKLDLPLSASK